MSTANSLPIATRQHSFPLVPGSTALLIVDMQNDFCHPDGFCCSEVGLDVTAARAIIPQIQKVLNWARQENLLVIFTRESHRPDLSDLAPSKKVRYENGGCPVGAQGKMGRYLIQGEKGTEIISELQPLEGEIQLDKPAHSVFVLTALEAVLRRHGITHLIITGVTTECCVLGSYRHASDLGFYCLLLEDCCAAFSEDEHQAAIKVLLSEGGVVGWVTTANELLKPFGRN